ncbi:MAG TPA: DegT/DnrJ/EryC1/StrS aminotransferase family protein [Opitutaceae bacterium]|nr:DegT/DnrJ/EryC1/StrS aminotransferase family protein [Opitutaceae bacterium]
MPARKRPLRPSATRRPAAPGARRRPVKPPVPAAAPAAAAFLPFARPAIDEETIAGVADVLRSGWITSGPKVKEFEAQLSAYCGGRPVRAFNSGTGTMEIALRIAGVGPGHEVITSPLTWVATSNVVLEVGARPVFADIDPVTRNIDLDRVAAAITPATRAVIPVDLAGLPVDRDRLYALTKAHGLRVVEDAAQAFGSSWAGRRIGACGDLVSFSFHANKNITTAEGGALVLNDEREARLAEQYRLQGVVRTGFDGMEVGLVGGKFNLTDVAARIGLGQLPHLAGVTARRRELARAYFAAFDTPAIRGLGLGLPPADFTNSNWHMFQVVLPEERLAIRRAAVMEQMQAAGIGTGVHYPAIHLFALYRRMGWKPGDFPHAEYAGRNILTLPLFPAMTAADVRRVAVTLTDILVAHQKQ